MKITDVLKKTRLTEKAYNGISANKYIFEVDTHATKDDIKHAVEGLYNVSVIDVNTIMYRGKKKVRGTKRTIVKTGKMKKAIVEVAEGQTISTFDEIFKSDKNSK